MKIDWSFHPPMCVCLGVFLNNFLELVDLAGPRVSTDAGGLKGKVGGLFALDFNHFIIYGKNPFPSSPSLRRLLSVHVV